MKEFVLILANPKSCFENFKTTQFSLGKGLFLLILLIIINNILLFPINTAVTNHSEFLSKMSADKVEMMKAMQEKMKYISLFTSALFFIIKMFFYTLIVWVLSIISKKAVPFLQLLSLVVISFFVVVLGDIVNTGILYSHGIGKITSEYDIHKTGLNLFFNIKNTGPVLFTALSYINPFQIWFAVLLILGLKGVAKIPIKDAIIITIIFLVITITIPVLGVYLSEIVKHKSGLI